MIPSRLLCLLLVLPLTAVAATAQESSLAAFAGGKALDAAPVNADGQSTSAWQATGSAKVLTLKPQDGWSAPAQGPLYLEITYLDKGYGHLNVTYKGADGKQAKPEKSYHTVLLDSGKWATAYFRLDASPLAAPEIQVNRDRGADADLAIAKAGLQDKPFDNAHFQYVLDEPWRRPYVGEVVPAPDNTTLKGKVMVGYQGWFHTPNDPYDRGWGHWGDMGQTHFSTDMWPDPASYPPEAYDKACDVKTASGKVGYLFSSAWPEVARTHFRWMRENNIDGAFVQRFGGDNWAINKTPQWVIGAVREAADKEGRIWAIEYDLSGVSDAQALEHLQKDWTWLVDEFGLLKDPNYARVNGKPVVFVWGPGVGGRDLTPATTAKIADYFKNDPKYGGNYFILGGPGGWKKLGPDWLDAYKKADGFLGWMSTDYAADLAQCKEMGIDYYPHVWAGFSWANMKHLASGSNAAYTPREKGKVYEQRFSKAAAAGVDRLFVGMWDEYDESTAIMPMSDDPPVPIERPGTTVKFYANPKEQESAPNRLMPQAQFALDGTSPIKNVQGDNFLMRWEGLIVPPSDGSYTFAIEGVEGDSASLWLDDKRVIEAKKLGDGPEKTFTVNLTANKRVIFRIDYLHGAAHGNFQLVWQGPGIDRQPVPASAFVDAWGRFITNEGQSPDLYLKLTGEARDMINGKRPATDLSVTSSN